MERFVKSAIVGRLVAQIECKLLFVTVTALIVKAKCLKT
jgi:hypothetical protein